MGKFRARTGSILKRTAAVLFSAAFFTTAVYGAYRFADMALSRMYPAGKRAASPALSVSSASSLLPASSRAPGSSVASAPLPGMFAAFGEQAQAKLGQMTLREKVGQVFLFVCPASGAVKTIDDDQPGGYCLMARDFQGRTAEQVKKTLKAYQSSSKIPMLLCCDEEGGAVVRVSANPSLSPRKSQSPQAVFKAGGFSAVTQDTVKKIQLLKSLGLNMNLAPVCDVSTSASDFIYARSFGKDAAQTAKYVQTSVEAYAGQNFACVLKHFPGYGNNADTHKGAARDERSFQTFQQSDFLPFAAGIRAGAPCVMVCHNIVECMDPKRPASLSPRVHEVLRNTLGFSGVILTDDLSMKAVIDYAGGRNPSVEAFQAGNDLLLTSDISGSFNALYTAVKDGTVSEKRLDESVLRILAWKYQMRLLS